METHMVDMSLHDVSGVVGWCLGAYSEVENTYVHRLHTFLHTGSGLYNPLQHSRIVPRPHILYNISTTLYSLQLYSISTVYNLYNTPLLRPLVTYITYPPALRGGLRPPLTYLPPELHSTLSYLSRKRTERREPLARRIRVFGLLGIIGTRFGG